MTVHVLRLSHRASRDKRATTHLGLVARAFGAEKLLVTGAKDEHLADSIQRVVESWGGPFELEFAQSWRDVVASHKDEGFTAVHLTMYGLPVREHIADVRNADKILIILGGEKVPGEVYEDADYNISVTSQPHSEIAALAVFLDRLFEGQELSLGFKNARMRLIPRERGKKIVRN